MSLCLRLHETSMAASVTVHPYEAFSRAMYTCKSLNMSLNAMASSTAALQPAHQEHLPHTCGASCSTFDAPFRLSNARHCRYCATAPEQSRRCTTDGRRADGEQTAMSEVKSAERCPPPRAIILARLAARLADQTALQSNVHNSQGPPRLPHTSLQPSPGFCERVGHGAA